MELPTIGSQWLSPDGIVVTVTKVILLPQCLTTIMMEVRDTKKTITRDSIQFLQFTQTGEVQ